MSLRRIAWTAAFVLGLVVLDQAVGRVLGSLARDVRRGTDGLAVANRALASDATVFVLGSSRAYRHYDPSLLGEALGAPVHNAGAPGQELVYVRGLQDLVMRLGSARLLIVQIDATSLVNTLWDPRVAVLAPFLDESPVVQRLIYARGPTERFKYLSRTFRFNNRLLELVRGRGDARQPYGPLDAAPGEAVLREVMWPRRQQREEERLLAGGVPPSRIALLEGMIAAARERGVGLVFATGPRWRPETAPGDDERRLLGVGAAVAREHGVPFLEITLDTHPEFRDPALWADTQHLNRQGAERFSRLAAERLAALRPLAGTPVGGSPRPDDSPSTRLTQTAVGATESR